MTPDEHAESLQREIDREVRECVCSAAGDHFLAKVKRKIVSVAEAKRIEKRRRKKEKKALRRAGLASALLAVLWLVSCSTTGIDGEAEYIEPETVAPVQAVVTGTVGTMETECETPCGDVCCTERAFCYEGECRCFAGLDECGDICCPEDTPVCFEGECEP
jgi:hypothetical protein